MGHVGKENLRRILEVNFGERLGILFEGIMGPVMENPLVEHALVQLDRPLVKGKEVGAQPPGEGIGVPQDGR
ncbi:MAG: hypothetical protein PHU54_05720, partial [Candidatus Omnitrophica bacterium]|nr:hypothetical protein [Candidatus Omnitrophota bacterium]